jgi:hypothetical protein
MSTDTQFAEILSSCRTPSLDVMRKALKDRSNLSSQEADFVTYMAGFTQYIEAASILGEFGITCGDDLPIVCDSMSRSIHIKFLINDLTFGVESLTPDYLAEKYHTTKSINRVAGKLSSGVFVESLSEATRGFSTREFYAFCSQYESGIIEEVVSVAKTIGGQPHSRLVFHIARIPARNYAVNLQRIFMHVGAIVVVNDPDQGFNLSIRRLRDATEIHSSLKAAQWYVINTSVAGNLIDFLHEIEAKYMLIPYQGLEGNYVAGAMEKIEAEINKMKGCCDSN